MVYLLMKGADPYIIDSSGKNCFHILAFKGHVETLKLIINFKRHEIRKEILKLLQNYKKEYNFLKSDIKNGQLVSTNANQEFVKENFEKFLPRVHALYEEYLDMVRAMIILVHS